MPIRGVLSKLLVLSFAGCMTDWMGSPDPPVLRGLGWEYTFWVYILSSRTGTLYTGITGFFTRRILQHKYDSIEGFTKKYRCHRLVYYESHQDVEVAIGREKQIKRWRRKIALAQEDFKRLRDSLESVFARWL